MLSDNGGEFLAVSAYLKQHGINHQVTAPYFPQQNSVAERLNRILVEGARAMLIEKKISKNFWAEVVMYTNNIKKLCINILQSRRKIAF